MLVPQNLEFRQTDVWQNSKVFQISTVISLV